MVQDGLRRRNLHVNNIDSIGSGTFNVLTGSEVNATNLAATNISGTTISANDIQIPLIDNKGMIIEDVPAAAVISGGMWAVVYAGSAATPVPAVKPKNDPQATGICLETTASGANPRILTRGYYHGLIADASLSSGVGFAVGAGAALNTVKATGAGLNRGTVVIGGGSEAYVKVYLW